jgi:hypothetical protein
MLTLRLALTLPLLLAQNRVIASVPSAEASTAGVLAVSGGKDLLGGSSVITALDRPAHVSLFRGGELLVCQTSVIHLASGARVQQLVGKQTPLLISLDRGALELRMPISADDVFLTPDLRFVAADARNKPAQLDLAIRVAPGGDTCVENRGKKAPTVQITDTFGQAAYLLKPGQHVLFEHGSLNEVVDHESSPCGCPAPQSMSLADAALRGKGKGSQSFPFPAAVSEGLAPASPLPPEKSGEVHTQVAGTLAYDPSDAAPAAASSAPDQTQPPAKPLPPLTPAEDPAPKPGLFHAVGRFFKKIFAR